MTREIIIPLSMSFTAIVSIYLVTFTMPIVWTFIPGIIISFIVYLKIFYRKDINVSQFTSLYLFALGIQFLHFFEEYLTDFNVVVPQLLGLEAFSKDFWVGFNMVAYFIFIMGGIVLVQGKQNLLIIPIFFILVGVIFNSIVHSLIALYVGGYFSGLFTALIYIPIGILFIKSLAKQRSKQ